MSLVTILEREEGERLFVYDDATGLPIKPGSWVKGHPTIGWGRALDVEGISHAEAAVLLTNDTGALQAQLKGMGWYAGLDPARQDVVAAMAYQMGTRGLLAFTGMIACVVKKDWTGAAAGMMASLWARQTPGRAARMAATMRTGVSS